MKSIWGEGPTPTLFLFVGQIKLRTKNQQYPSGAISKLPRKLGQRRDKNTSLESEFQIASPYLFGGWKEVIWSCGSFPPPISGREERLPLLWASSLISRRSIQWTHRMERWIEYLSIWYLSTGLAPPNLLRSIQGKVGFLFQSLTLPRQQWSRKTHVKTVGNHCWSMQIILRTQFDKAVAAG